jgi:hypothetical protein
MPQSHTLAASGLADRVAQVSSTMGDVHAYAEVADEFRLWLPQSNAKKDRRARLHLFDRAVQSLGGPLMVWGGGNRQGSLVDPWRLHER